MSYWQELFGLVFKLCLSCPNRPTDQLPITRRETKGRNTQLVNRSFWLLDKADKHATKINKSLFYYMGVLSVRSFIHTWIFSLSAVVGSQLLYGTTNFISVAFKFHYLFCGSYGSFSVLLCCTYIVYLGRKYMDELESHF